jgi:hypothetical protein
MFKAIAPGRSGLSAWRALKCMLNHNSCFVKLHFSLLVRHSLVNTLWSNNCFPTHALLTQVVQLMEALNELGLHAQPAAHALLHVSAV